jgi:hypothetical protein
MLGPDQPVILHLLDIPPAAQSLEGVKMELIDAALPLLAGEHLQSIGPCCTDAAAVTRPHQQTEKQERAFMSLIKLTRTISSDGASHPLGRKVCWRLHTSGRRAKAASIVRLPASTTLAYI